MDVALLLMKLILSEASLHQSHSLVSAQGSASGTQAVRMRRMMHSRTAVIWSTYVKPLAVQRVRIVCRKPSIDEMHC